MVKKLLFCLMCLVCLGGCSKGTQEDNLDDLFESTTETNIDSAYNVSDGRGTDNYDLWWNITEVDGKEMIVVDEQQNRLAMLVFYPDKIPSDISMQLCGLIYVETNTTKLEGRTLVLAKANTSLNDTSIYIDITGVENQLELNENSRIYVLLTKNDVGMVETEGKQEIVVTGKVLVK